MLNTRFWVLAGITLAAAAARLISLPANVAPITAMALFGGAYFASKRSAFAVPLAALVLSDLALGFGKYAEYRMTTLLFIPFVYGCFAATAGLGLLIRSRRSPVPIALAVLASSVLFYLVTNFGAWLIYPSRYSQTWDGLLASYVAGLPFFRNTLIGDAICTAILFGGFALAEWYFTALREPAPVLNEEKPIPAPSA